MTVSPGSRPPEAQGDLDLVIARLLTIGTYASILVLAGGLAAMVASGISPFAAAPGLDPGRIVSDIVTFQPEGFLWLGLLVVIATPAARIVAAFVGFLRGAEWEMAAIAAAILGVIALSVILARLAEG